jgi:hypothetical protein
MMENNTIVSFSDTDETSVKVGGGRKRRRKRKNLGGEVNKSRGVWKKTKAERVGSRVCPTSWEDTVGQRASADSPSRDQFASLPEFF